MATHSSILAWRIPGTEEPGRLQSIGSHKVGHDWSDLACTHIYLRSYYFVASPISLGWMHLRIRLESGSQAAQCLVANGTTLLTFTRLCPSFLETRIIPVGFAVTVWQFENTSLNNWKSQGYLFQKMRNLTPVKANLDSIKRAVGSICRGAVSGWEQSCFPKMENLW